MRVTGWIVPALLLAAACTSEPEQPAEPAEDPTAEQEAAPPVPSLEGEWDVVSIDGAELTQFYDMNVNVTGDRLTVESDCVRIGFDYSQERNIVSFEPAPVPSCERTRTYNEEQIEQVLTNANIAMFPEDGRAEISGPGGRATLVRR